MFIGEYNCKLDQKKRLSIPAKFRLGFGKKVVITKGLDNCLFLYPIKEWGILAKKLSELPLSQSDARAFSRSTLAAAREVILDKLGRILVPDYLKKYAALSKNVIVVGLYDRVEIWEEKRWSLYQQKTGKEAGDIAERLKEFGI